MAAASDRSRCDQVTYYHVELPRHAVLLAEGLPAETYLDVGYRDNFENNDGSIRLFADFSGDGPDIAILREGEACAPFVVHGPELDAVRDAISRRGAPDCSSHAACRIACE